METDKTKDNDAEYNEDVASGSPLTLGIAASDGTSPGHESQLKNALVRRLRVSPPTPSQRIPPTRNRRVLPS